MASKGNGRHYSGWRGSDHKRYNTISWKDPAMVRENSKKVTRVTNKRQADRYNKLSRNPSGAPNMQTTT